MNKVIAESVKYGNKRNMKFQLFFFHKQKP